VRSSNHARPRAMGTSMSEVEAAGERVPLLHQPIPGA
jgi:hypothetical protein